MSYRVFADSWQSHKHKNVFLKLSKSGLNFEQIREKVYSEIEPLMPSRNVRDFRIEILAGYYFTISHEKTNQDLSDISRDSYKIISDSLKVDLRKTIEILAESQTYHSDAMEDFWGAFSIQQPPNGASIRDKAKYIFDFCEELIEGMIKRYLNSYWQLVCHTEGIPCKALDLGMLIREMESRGYFTRLDRVSPLGIKVSQIRNVAAHRSYRIEGDEIWYCIEKNCSNYDRKTSLDELFEVEEFLSHVINSLNTPLLLKLSELGMHLPQTDPKRSIDSIDSYRRKESRLLDLLLVFSMFGYDFVEYFIEEDKFYIKFDDVRGSSSENFYRCPELMIFIWKIFKVDGIFFAYQTQDGVYSHVWYSDAENCQKRIQGERSLEDYSVNLRLFFLNENGEMFPISPKFKP